MDFKVEAGHNVISTRALDKFILYLFCHFVRALVDLCLFLRATVKEVEAMADNLLDKVLSVDPLGVFIDAEGAVLQTMGPARNSQSLVVLIKLQNAFDRLNVRKQFFFLDLRLSDLRVVYFGLVILGVFSRLGDIVLGVIESAVRVFFHLLLLVLFSDFRRRHLFRFDHHAHNCLLTSIRLKVCQGSSFELFENRFGLLSGRH